MAQQLKRRFETIATGKSRLGFDPLNNEMARLANLRPDEITLDPDQPRKEMGDIEDLKASIAEHGILQPLIVAPIDESHYRLIAGERRFTAALALNLTTVPAIVRSVEDHRRLEVQLIENLHRKDLTPFEEAEAFWRLQDEFGLTQEQLAKRMGRTQAAVSQLLRVLDLPATIREEYKTSYNSAKPVSKSLLMEIARQETPERQEALWEQARSGDLTVQKARKARSGEDGVAGAGRGKGTGGKTNSTYRHIIKTSAAMVILEFQTSEPTLAEMISTLKQALVSLEGTKLSSGKKAPFA